MKTILTVVALWQMTKNEMLCRKRRRRNSMGEMLERKYTKDEKLSKLFDTVLQMEEHQRIMKARLSELAGFKMAQRAVNLVGLLQSERKDMDEDIVWAKGLLNATEPDNTTKTTR